MTNERVAAAKPWGLQTSDPAIQAGKLWEQHCSWCPRCDPTMPRCELGRKAYDLYEWLDEATRLRRAG